MARKPLNQILTNHDRWLVSYADFITLLLAIFIVIAASSQSDKLRASMVSASVKAAFEKSSPPKILHDSRVVPEVEPRKDNPQVIGAADVPAGRPATAELLPSMRYLTKSLEQEILQGKIDMHLEARGLVVSLRQATFFPSGADQIDTATYPSIQKIADTIRDLPNAVRLEGHADSMPIHTSRFRSNWELSAARSIAMMELLTQRFGLPENRLAIAGYGGTTPIESNETQTGRAHNRRVDIVILNQKAALGEPGGNHLITRDQDSPTGAVNPAAGEPR